MLSLPNVKKARGTHTLAASAAASLSRPELVVAGTISGRDRDELLADVASMYYEVDLDQESIAVRLGISRSSVSRMLTEASRGSRAGPNVPCHYAVCRPGRAT